MENEVTGGFEMTERGTRISVEQSDVITETLFLMPWQEARGVAVDVEVTPLEAVLTLRFGMRLSQVAVPLKVMVLCGVEDVDGLMGLKGKTVSVLRTDSDYRVRES